MKKLVFGLLAALLITLAPVEAGTASLSNDPVSLARWAGCNAQVVTSDLHSPVESFYAGGSQPAIYFGTAPGIAKDVAIIIMLHEIGHCLQDQYYGNDGTFQFLYMLDSVPFELDADRYSADLACSLGMEGVRMVAETFDWAHDTFDYKGDPGHGTLDQRKAAGASAQACYKPIQGA